MPPTIREIAATAVGAIDFLYGLGGLIFVGILIAQGFAWMTSRGDSKALEEIQKRIVLVIIGFILFFFSTRIVETVYSAFDVRDCNGEKITIGFQFYFRKPCPDSSAP